MTPEEKQAVEAMQAKVLTLKASAFDYLKSISRLGEQELRDAGFLFTNADAVLFCLKDKIKQIDKVYADHLKKYPD